jgi:folate-binding protein YgfZ
MLEQEIRAVRAGAGWFELAERGVVSVSGTDARRWLNGMVTNDVAALDEGPERSGCRALVLTSKAGVVAEVQVLARPEGFWLDLPRAAIADLLQRLSKLLIADDVTLADRSAELVRFGIEGPRSQAVLEHLLGAAFPLAPNACATAPLGDLEAVVARFGWSGEEAYQLFVPRALAGEIRDRLRAQGDAAPTCSAEALEVLRIEAGRPRLGAELSPDVLPPEARLEAAISYTKGCYTGQEIVARLRSRGHVNHLLVGLQFPDGEPALVGAVVRAGDVAVGEITSAAVSPNAGAIALAFVRVGNEAPGTKLAVEGRVAQVCALPFVTPQGLAS